MQQHISYLLMNVATEFVTGNLSLVTRILIWKDNHTSPSSAIKFQNLETVVEPQKI